MNIKEFSENNKLILLLEGHLDESSAAQVREKTEQALLKDFDTIYLNLNKVDYISSIGISTLIGAHKKAVKLGKRVRLSEISGKAEHILDSVKILPMFRS